MASFVQQSTTQLALKFFLVLSSDHITPATGLGATPTVTIRKEGGAFAAPAGAISEIANGWYQVAANATDVNTLGEVLLHATGTGADPTDVVAATVVGFNPQAANINANVVQWNGSTVSAPATAGIPDVNVKNINNVSGSSVTTVAANVGTTQPINFTGTGGAALVTTNATQFGGQPVQLDTNNLPKVDIEAINANMVAADALAMSTRSICWGTASAGSTISVTASTLNNPAALTDVGQLIGRTIIFLGATATANVQAQASTITASTTGATPVISFVAMTHSPASGDLFVVL
jgi:phosphotransferase system HPr-like phosphotransfer protein